MSAEVLLARMLAQRERWLDLPEGKRLRVRRPSEAQLAAMRGRFSADDAKACIVGWSAFTEATLLGKGHGAEDVEVDFAPELASEYFDNHVEEFGEVITALVAEVTAYLERRTDAKKNSPPTSTPSTASGGKASSSPN